MFIEDKFELIPIVDQRKKFMMFCLLNRFLIKVKERIEKVEVPVVIMAGGKGTRMEPFTKVLPKPLIPVHEKL